jgi:hypothetical protein
VIRRSHLALAVSITYLAAAPLRAEQVTDNIVWFEVAAADPEFAESYLLPITSPDDIAQARARLASGETSGVGSIVVAKIRAGGDGLNRNLRAAGEPRWNWHVEDFVGFADIAMEICDGWPGFIAEDPAAFIANTEGLVCLWGYRLQRELESAPRMELGNGLDGIWYSPEIAGQGLAIDVLPDSNLVSAGWFTWESQSGMQQWYTAAGNIADDSATMAVMQPAGGMFDAAAPVTSTPVGTARVTFLSCNLAEFEFDLGPDRGVAARQLKRFDSSFDCSR